MNCCILQVDLEGNKILKTNKKLIPVFHFIIPFHCPIPLIPDRLQSGISSLWSFRTVPLLLPGRHQLKSGISSLWQHKWGDAYPWPARVPITWYAYCFEMLAYWCLLPSFSIHSPLGHLAHKCKQNACIRHLMVTVQYMVMQIIILFLHNIISQPL